MGNTFKKKEAKHAYYAFFLLPQPYSFLFAFDILRVLGLFGISFKGVPVLPQFRKCFSQLAFSIPQNSYCPHSHTKYVSYAVSVLCFIPLLCKYVSMCLPKIHLSRYSLPHFTFFPHSQLYTKRLPNILLFSSSVQSLTVPFYSVTYTLVKHDGMLKRIVLQLRLANSLVRTDFPLGSH